VNKNESQMKDKYEIQISDVNEKSEEDKYNNVPVKMKEMDGEVTKVKKARNFKKKTDKEDVGMMAASGIAFNDTSSVIKDDPLINSNRNHISRDIAKTLFSNVPFTNYEKSSSIKIANREVEELIINNQTNFKFPVEGKLENATKLNHVNYVTNPNKKNEIIIENEIEKDNWFDNKNYNKGKKLNNSHNENEGKKLSLEFNDSLNEAIFDKKNHSYNFNDESDNEMNLSLPSIPIPNNLSFSKNSDHNNSNSNKDLNNSINNLNNSINNSVQKIEREEHYENPVNISSRYGEAETNWAVKRERGKSLKNKIKSNLFNDMLGDEDEFDMVLSKKSVVKEDSKLKKTNSSSLLNVKEDNIMDNNIIEKKKFVKKNTIGISVGLGAGVPIPTASKNNSTENKLNFSENINSYIDSKKYSIEKKNNFNFSENKLNSSEGRINTAEIINNRINLNESKININDSKIKHEEKFSFSDNKNPEMNKRMNQNVVQTQVSSPYKFNNYDTITNLKNYEEICIQKNLQTEENKTQEGQEFSFDMKNISFRNNSPKNNRVETTGKKKNYVTNKGMSDSFIEDFEEEW
jgi:hypothetical protein